MLPKELEKTKEYKVPAEINVALLHTIIAVTALRDVLIKETDALKVTNTKAFMDLQDEKVEVARRYEVLVNALMDRATEVKNADAKLKAQLERLQDDFGMVAKTNREWIERMRDATKKLGETIMQAARKSAEGQSQFAYGSSGKMQKGIKATIGVEERA